MTTTEKSPRPAFSRSRTQHPSKEHSQDTPGGHLWRGMILMENLDRFGRAWCGALLRMDRETARAEIAQLRPGDLTDERLTIAARAIWLTIHDGETPNPRAVADAAYRHDLVNPAFHDVFIVFLFELLMCKPPARAILDAPTAPAYMARTLAALEVAP